AGRPCGEEGDQGTSDAATTASGLRQGVSRIAEDWRLLEGIGGRELCPGGGSAQWACPPARAPPLSSRTSEASVGICFHGVVTGFGAGIVDPDASRGMTSEEPVAGFGAGIADPDASRGM